MGFLGVATLAASGSVYEWPLWAKVVAPLLILLAGIAMLVLYYFSRKFKFKTDESGRPSVVNRVWPVAVVVLGIVFILVGIGIIIASTNAQLFGQAST